MGNQQYNYKLQTQGNIQIINNKNKQQNIHQLTTLLHNKLSKQNHPNQTTTEPKHKQPKTKQQNTQHQTQTNNHQLKN